MIIRSNGIYTEDGCVSGYMTIQDGIIQRIEESYQGPEEIIDYQDCLILPGFIDIHTHGYQGHQAQALDRDELLALKQAMPKAGVTGFLPTAGAHFEKEYENLELLADVIEAQQPNQGSMMLGIHMEGPFLNINRRGAFLPHELLSVDIKKAQSYINASRNHITYLAMAPELDPDGKLIHFLHDQNIVVAGAHTTATYEQYQAGIEYGIQASTHTGNGMNQMDRRDVGALGAALLSDELYCEAICDFHHVDPKMLDIMFRVKTDGCRKFIMISDSTIVSGLPVGIYGEGDQQVTILENGLILNYEGTICGSARDMLYGFQNLKNKMHLPVEDILMMTSLNPAKLLHFDHKKGSIKQGKDADFIILNQRDELQATFVEGVCVYQGS